MILNLKNSRGLRPPTTPPLPPPALTLNLFFLRRVQMSSSETPQHLYWLGGGLGGITLASVSASIMWFAEGKKPSVKTIGRDLILGAILFFLLLQLLPESTMSLLTTIVAAVAVKNEFMGGSGGSVVDSITGTSSSASSSSSTSQSAALDDMELRVGVPSF